MTALIEGRVVDLEGQPVAGARVLVDYSFVFEPSQGGEALYEGMPSVAVTDAAGQYLFTSETHPELEKEIQEIRDRARVFEGKHPHDLAARTIHGQQASQRIIFDVNGGTTKLSDLVLEPGVAGHVLVRWSDDVPATGVSVEVWLQRVQPESLADEEAGLLSFKGATDERGELVFGPVLDREYRVSVRASHPEGPRHAAGWTGRIPRHDVLLVILPRGRKTRGWIVTASGRPAVGYRVAPWEEKSGDPEERRVVETDADGRFEVTGLASRNGVVAIYDRLPPLPRKGERPPEEELRAALDARVGSPTNPLLFREIPDDDTEVGTISLPTLGTFPVRLEDARGDRPLSGRAHWFHSGTLHGSSSSWADADGIVRFERIPLGIAIALEVTIQDSQHGELEQRFKIAEVKEETVTLRVTGAGTVVVRFHPAGALDEPLEVHDSSASFHECCQFTYERGRTAELRGWVTPDVYPALHLKARGFRERVIGDLQVRDDGPTFVDVELETLPK